jgi:hypothetical protein
MCSRSYGKEISRGPGAARPSFAEREWSR